MDDLGLHAGLTQTGTGNSGRSIIRGRSLWVVCRASILTTVGFPQVMGDFSLTPGEAWWFVLRAFQRRE